MKREIKFRAWDLETKSYRNQGTIQTSLNGDIFVLVPSSTRGFGNYKIKIIKDIVLEQFTGLTDKNGKDIYENDIIKDEYGGLGFVIWNKDSASFMIEYKEVEVQEFLNMNEWAEVVGNIHENPELL